MSTQRHVIKRQIIELNIRRPAEAQRLQAEVSRVYRQRIIPLIDQICTELSEPDQLYRIETLALDLGVLDPNQLEADFVTQVNRALRQALAVQIQTQAATLADQRQNRKANSQLELFAHFARTGTLPWWADSAQPQLMEACLQHLLNDAPEALRRLMGALAQERRPLARLALHYTDEWLAALAGLLAPALKPSFAQEPQFLLNLLPPPAQRRRTIWTHLLYVASLTGAHMTAFEPFYLAVLNRVATELGRTSGALRVDFAPLLEKNQSSISPQLRQLLENIQGQRSDASSAARELLVQRLVQWLEGGNSLAALMPVQPTIAQQRLLHRLESNPSLAAIDIRRLIDRADLSVAETEQLIQWLATPLPVQALLPTVAKTTPVDLSGSDVDEIYIDNAGLVILWPFLENFFARLDLLEGKQFRNDIARQRAVGLLQVLAMADVVFAEYHVPLNKVLCGMALTEVFDFGLPLSATELEECTDLLTAVIEHAPILRSMSVAGFQGTFLLRQGVLRTRDGAWLLQVERETYDIVLERFPWQWAWVKLPWMDAPLRVEWL